MSAFDFATVAVSFVLGLGVTYVLESLLELFRERRRCRLDWPPLVWVAIVLIYDFQFWWALYELNQMPSLTIAGFSLLLALAGLLFLAGGLVLPGPSGPFPEDLGEYFCVDGSWGLAALALYSWAAVGANVFLFGSVPLEPLNVLNVVLGCLAAGVGVSRSRSAIVALTVVFVPLFIVTMVLATPAAY